MSRIGKQPVTIPSGVTVTVQGSDLHVKGAKGELTFSFPAEHVDVKVEGEEVIVTAKSEETRNFQGMVRSILSNMVEGVTNGYKKVLEIHGVGYKAQVKGKTLALSLGFSHPVEVNPPEGITLSMNPEANNEIWVEGIDNQLVGEVAANIRKIRPPEPYKAKGVRYKGEYILRKAGKTAAK